jgi:hypothetical protein
MRLALTAALAALATAAGARVPAASPADQAPADQAYDARLRQSFAAAERFQGPLGGGWTVLVAGAPRYELQLADHDGRVQGAWRRLGARASGVIDSVERTASGVALRFDGAVLTLGPDRRAELRRAGVARKADLRRIGGDAPAP